jgi:hypothetical protein
MNLLQVDSHGMLFLIMYHCVTVCITVHVFSAEEWFNYFQFRVVINKSAMSILVKFFGGHSTYLPCIMHRKRISG